MSRSKRKNPYVTDQQSGKSKGDKRLASRRVRNDPSIPDGSAYKKYSNSWDICDWSFYDPKKGTRK